MVLRRALAAFILLPVLVLSAAAHAFTCEDLFTSGMTKEAARNRRGLAFEYRTHLRSITLVRDTLRDQFFQRPFSEGPALASETLNFILNSSHREAMMPSARTLIAKDPYFQWLAVTRTKGTSDPAELFFGSLLASGPSHLDAKLSFIRIVRDLDPKKRAPNDMQAILLLYLNKIATLIEHRVLPMFESEPLTAQMIETWNLSPTLHENYASARRMFAPTVAPQTHIELRRILELEQALLDPGDFNQHIHKHIEDSNADIKFGY